MLNVKPGQIWCSHDSHDYHYLITEKYDGSATPDESDESFMRTYCLETGEEDIFYEYWFRTFRFALVSDV